MAVKLQTRILFFMCVGIFFSTCLLFLLIHHSSHTRTHQITKRKADKSPEPPVEFSDFSANYERTPPDEEDTSLLTESEEKPPSEDYDFPELRPGELICELQSISTNSRTIETPDFGEKIPTDIETEEENGISEINPNGGSKDTDINKESTEVDLSDLTKEVDNGDKEPVKTDPETDEGPISIPLVDRGVEKEVIVSGWTDEEKNIGCCPSGDRKGVPFKSGMACCVNQIYNATEMFCCLSKATVLDITRENLVYCYPGDKIPFCRKSDLGLENLPPLDAICKNTVGKNKGPSECTFICPEGSQVRGDKRVTCSEVGIWNDANPQCCEGCPSDFEQDIWFLVEVDEGIGVGNLSSVRSFIKLLLGYFPIGQDNVRVSVTPYNSRVLEGGWKLDRYDSFHDLNKAINKLPREGSGRNMGEVLQWLADNAFEGELGDERNVSSLVVLITTGPPDDNILQAALEVIHHEARFVIISVGPNGNVPEFNELVSPVASENYLHVPTFHYLDQDRKYLYNLLCQEHCLTLQQNPK